MMTGGSSANGGHNMVDGCPATNNACIQSNRRKAQERENGGGSGGSSSASVNLNQQQYEAYMKWKESQGGNLILLI